MAAQYTADGFRDRLHVNTGCVDWTPKSLANFYQSQLKAGTLPTQPAAPVERAHPLRQLDRLGYPAKSPGQHGIRLDTNYYYYPPAWVLERPGMFTGSGMVMRFADLDGTMIDVYPGCHTNDGRVVFAGLRLLQPGAYQYPAGQRRRPTGLLWRFYNEYAYGLGQPRRI